MNLMDPQTLGALGQTAGVIVVVVAFLRNQKEKQEQYVQEIDRMVAAHERAMEQMSADLRQLSADQRQFAADQAQLTASIRDLIASRAER